MSTFLNAVHVLVAVLVIGPLVVAPFSARGAIARRSADGVRTAANHLLLFGAGSVLVAGLGVATVLTDDEWTLATPWVLIASTLYVVALALIGFYGVPALRKAAHMVAAAEPGQAEDLPPEPTCDSNPTADSDSTPPAPAEPSTAADLRTVERLHTISARVTGAGWLLLLTFAAITVLMTTRPF